MTYATLVGTNLSGVMFLVHVNFRGATLTSINLSGLDLTTDNLCLARLDAVDFTGSDLTGAIETTCEPCQPGSIGICIL